MANKDRGIEERLAAMEQKLDRVLTAVEGNAAAIASLQATVGSVERGVSSLVKGVQLIGENHLAPEHNNELKALLQAAN